VITVDVVLMWCMSAIRSWGWKPDRQMVVCQLNFKFFCISIRFRPFTSVHTFNCQIYVLLWLMECTCVHYIVGTLQIHDDDNDDVIPKTTLHMCRSLKDFFPLRPFQLKWHARALVSVALKTRSMVSSSDLPPTIPRYAT